VTQTCSFVEPQPWAKPDKRTDTAFCRDITTGSHDPGFQSAGQFVDRNSAVYITYLIVDNEIFLPVGSYLFQLQRQATFSSPDVHADYWSGSDTSDSPCCHLVCNAMGAHRTFWVRRSLWRSSALIRSTLEPCWLRVLSLVGRVSGATRCVL